MSSPHPAVHADLVPILNQFKAFHTPTLNETPPQVARNLPTLTNAVDEILADTFTARALTLVRPNPEPVDRIEHILINTSSKDDPDDVLLARVYYPKTTTPLSRDSEEERLLPVVLYFHGGGWVIANLDTYDASCRAISNAAGAIVVSVAYRQAPEFPFPNAIEDAYVSLQWVLNHARDFGGDPARVVVGGESAGGNLATVSCLMAQERGGILPEGQLLIYPVVDATEQRPSYAENTNTVPLNSAMMSWFFNHYLGNNQDLRSNIHVSPLLADLNGLPPALVITAELDPLRDEGKAYADKLQAAGVPTEYHLAQGMTHEFFGLAGVVKPAKESLDIAAGWLKRQWDWGHGLDEGSSLETPFPV